MAAAGAAARRGVRGEARRHVARTVLRPRVRGAGVPPRPRPCRRHRRPRPGHVRRAVRCRILGLERVHLSRRAVRVRRSRDAGIRLRVRRHGRRDVDLGPRRAGGKCDRVLDRISRHEAREHGAVGQSGAPRRVVPAGRVPLLRRFRGRRGAHPRRNRRERRHSDLALGVGSCRRGAHAVDDDPSSGPSPAAEHVEVSRALRAVHDHRARRGDRRCDQRAVRRTRPGGVHSEDRGSRSARHGDGVRALVDLLRLRRAPAAAVDDPGGTRLGVPASRHGVHRDDGKCRYFARDRRRSDVRSGDRQQAAARRKHRRRSDRAGTAGDDAAGERTSRRIAAPAR